MSASDKKKLRKEQNSAALSEKQFSARKQQKKEKGLTITFIVAMALVVAIVLGSAISTPIRNMMIDGTVALTVNSHELSATEFNYFYMDQINSFYQQYSSYGEYADVYVQLFTGLNPAAPLSSQVKDTNTNKTWADYFIGLARDSAKQTYIIYDKAMSEGFKLSEEDQKTMDSIDSYISLYATLAQMSSADMYLKAQYGSSANMDSYREYYKVCYIASKYTTSIIEGFKFDDAAIREYEKDKVNEYSSYTWLSYYVNVSNYLTGGTKVTGEDGKETVTYSDAEKQAAVDAAKKDAEHLILSRYPDAMMFNKAIAALDINKDAATKPTCTENKAVLFSNMSVANDEIKEWLTSEDRHEGDVTFIARTTKDADNKETVNGYYVLVFQGVNENTMKIGTVRHLLVKFQGGTKDATTGLMTYTEDEKKAAKDKAESLLKQYLEGEKVTEEAFIELVKANSDDSSKSTGGLFEKITPDSGYVKAFTDWATGEHQKGDVEIIETEYGYHIMYYVGCEDLNYRDTLIHNELVAEAYNEWETGVMKTGKASGGDYKYVNKDLILSGAY